MLIVFVNSQLFAVTRDALESSSEPDVAILTTRDRKSWSKLYKHLSTLSPTNANFLTEINEALFVLNLDDYSLEAESDKAYKQWFWGQKAQNRWFDKVMQIIVANSGRAGLNGEHSPCDAVISCTALDFALQRLVLRFSFAPSILRLTLFCSESLPAKKGRQPSDDAVDRDVNVAEPTKLRWKIDETVEKAIELAKVEAQRLTQKLDTTVFEFKLYGSNYVRENGML